MSAARASKRERRKEERRREREQQEQGGGDDCNDGGGVGAYSSLPPVLSAPASMARVGLSSKLLFLCVLLHDLLPRGHR